jgi:thymidylate synthase (FAD)
VMQQARTHRVGCCLSGETLVEFGHPSLSDGEVYYRKTIKELADLWHHGRSHQATEGDALYMRKQISGRKLLQVDESTGFVQHTSIKNIYENGPREVWLIGFAGGQQSIKVTKDHKVLTPDGWKTFGELAIGDSVLSAHGVSNKKKALPVSIVSFERIGLEDTYDIEVEGPFHNFVANGIIVHNSFDVQSGRYTGKRICRAADREIGIEEVFYLRPAGHYTDRQGKRYEYQDAQRGIDLGNCIRAAERYRNRVVRDGFSEEHARGMIPFDIRQHFVVSFSLRALMHFLDMRSKLDAQLEIQQLCDLIFPHFKAWTPEIARWYEEKRLGRARLAP